MTLEDIKNYVYFRTNSDSTLFPAADQLISINRWLHKIWSMMIDSVDSWDIDDASRTDYAIMTTPLVASQRDYTIPASFKAVKIKRVDVTYDGTNYVKVEPWDSGLSTVGLGNNALTDANFSTSAPFYDLLGNAIFLYPLPTAAHVAAGAKLRLEYSRELVEVSSSDLSGGTLVPPMDEPFHMMLALGMAFDYSAAKSLSETKKDLYVELQDYEARLRRQYGRKDLDTKLQLRPEYTNYN